MKLAKRGYQLLKMKRSALIMEFLELAKEMRGLRENLRNETARAIESITKAEISEGRLAIERFSFMSGESSVSMNTKNVMGVRIPEIGINTERAVLTERFRAISVPSSINDSIDIFEKLFQSLITVVEKEKSMRRLLNEIDKTKRRSNAIEFVMIPKLNADAKYIRMRLDELERDTFTTLKIVKKKITAQEEGVESKKFEEIQASGDEQ
ncbi:V-type ATP synthase subunit D [Cuniculiplasma sp. SKW3]|uniref:V-type ATP synthase subunit D n=1 Tax=Cuniculiplasma sp. SKW3 TaxID=3400170 RepID=UPI003FD65BE5